MQAHEFFSPVEVAKRDQAISNIDASTRQLLEGRFASDPTKGNPMPALMAVREIISLARKAQERFHAEKKAMEEAIFPSEQTYHRHAAIAQLMVAETLKETASDMLAALMRQMFPAAVVAEMTDPNRVLN